MRHLDNVWSSSRTWRGHGHLYCIQVIGMSIDNWGVKYFKNVNQLVMNNWLHFQLCNYDSWWQSQILVVSRYIVYLRKRASKVACIILVLVAKMIALPSIDSSFTVVLQAKHLILHHDIFWVICCFNYCMFHIQWEARAKLKVCH